MSGNHFAESTISSKAQTVLLRKGTLAEVCLFRLGAACLKRKGTKSPFVFCFVSGQLRENTFSNNLLSALGGLCQ